MTEGGEQEPGTREWFAWLEGVKPLKGDSGGAVPPSEAQRVGVSGANARSLRSEVEAVRGGLRDKLPNILPERLGRKMVRTPDEPEQFAELDGNRKRLFWQGSLQVDATLDLHGKTEKEAELLFAQFLVHTLKRDYRFVQVITGKGEGVLIRALAGWLSRPEVRRNLAGVVEMPARKGGRGVYGLYLRKIRKPS